MPAAPPEEHQDQSLVSVPPSGGNSISMVGDGGARLEREAAVERHTTDSGESVDQLMTRIVAGDRAAFCRVYDLTIARVYGVIVEVVRDPHLAEVTAHHVMIEIWRAAPTCDTSRGTTMGWTISIAHRRAVDRVRSQVARRTREQRFTTPGTASARTPTPPGWP